MNEVKEKYKYDKEEYSCLAKATEIAIEVKRYQRQSSNAKPLPELIRMIDAFISLL